MSAGESIIRAAAEASYGRADSISAVDRSMHIMTFSRQFIKRSRPAIRCRHLMTSCSTVGVGVGLGYSQCVHGVAPAYLRDLCVPTTRHCHLRSSASAISSDWHSTGSTRPYCNWTTKFHSQRTSHMEPSATSTTVTGPVGEHLQAGTKDAPVVLFGAI